MNPGLCSAAVRRSASVALLTRRVLAALVAAILLPALAMAQTTTISGTVYDPRTTASALPLPNILVYVTTATPATLPSGVQCLTTGSIPADALVYATTAVDGSFTIKDVPVSTTYTLVIQAGKWRRQFSNIVVDTSPITGLQLHMPANHSQGDLPLIAIATGGVDGLECVFRNMGISDSEFSDDIADPGFTKRIHLYSGNSNTVNNYASPGVTISASTPSESDLISSPALLNNYDVVMFPCQGAPAAKTAAQMANIVNYTTAGGRLFTTHYSFDWLDSDSPFNSGFTSVSNGATTGVAHWDTDQNQPQPNPGVANVNTSFTDGATLSQWLYNAGATYKGLQNQIQVSTLRHDADSVIAPTQTWLTLNSSSTAANAVMQFTFNTPVGAAATNQCGRVLFNEYHVMNLSTSGKVYPKECTSTTILPQEMMLEYALYDLSAFVQPVVVPTLTLTFAPSPLIVQQGDAADQVNLTATNTSSSVAIDPSAVLSVILPTGLTATALAPVSSSSGWVCTLASLSCTRNASIPSSSSDAVLLTVSVPAYPAGGLTSYTGQITASVASPTFSSNVVGTDDVLFQRTPVITWPAPASTIYGIPLSTTQLNATASVGGSAVAGSFVYTPAAGAVLAVGTHPLSVTFTPTDTLHYTTATATNSITILTATPSVTLGTNTNPIFLSNPLTLTATVSSLGLMPTGTVIFYDGATQIGSSALSSSGIATFTTSSLSTGNHSLTASYAGDATYNAAASTALAQLVEDFTLKLGGSGTATLGLGQSATFPVTISPVVGTILPEAISFSVTGLPPLTSVSYSPTSLAAGSGSIVDYVQVSMSNSYAQVPPAPRGLQRALPLAFALLLLPFSGRVRRMARRWQGMVVLALASLLLAGSLSACGFTETPQSSTVTLKAASGNLSHTVTFKVTVK